MALFTNLKLEKAVQIKDRTRFDAGDSFVTKGATDITTLTVKPGSDASPISVFDSDLTERYLDYQFGSFNGDFDSTNNKIDFKENSGSELTATITPGSYTPATLATEVQTQLNSAGSLTYSVSVNIDDKMTISVSTGNFDLLPTTGTNADVSALPLMGFKPLSRLGRDDSGFDKKSTITGAMIEYLEKIITVEVGDGSSTQSDDYKIRLYSVEGDRLFSNDGDLVSIYSDVLRYLRPGRNTFLDMHRQAQENIMNWFEENGYTDYLGDKITKHNIVDVDELNNWSQFETLQLIFRDLVKSNDDEFYINLRNEFIKKANKARQRVILYFDYDNDGKAERGETMQIRSGRFYRQ